MADEKAENGELTEEELKADECKLQANEYFKGIIWQSYLFWLFLLSKNTFKSVEGIYLGLITEPAGIRTEKSQPRFDLRLSSAVDLKVLKKILESIAIQCMIAVVLWVEWI